MIVVFGSESLHLGSSLHKLFTIRHSFQKLIVCKNIYRLNWKKCVRVLGFIKYQLQFISNQCAHDVSIISVKLEVHPKHTCDKFQRGIREVYEQEA